MGISQNDPFPPDLSSKEALSISNTPSDRTTMGENDKDETETEEIDWMSYVAQAEDTAREYQTRKLSRSVTRANKAYRNEHYEGSKYLSSGYKGRTRLFVPKTRSSVRKNMAAAAASLFATHDAVTISATYEDDPIQRATADSLAANLNYRTSRSSKKSGFPWFQICMGAHLDGQLTGVSCTKQYWEYETIKTGETEAKTGVDETTGEYYDYDEPVTRVIKDRPMVDLVPIENLMVDPAAPWYDPVQGGSWFCVRYAMHLDDVRAMLDRRGPKDAWLEGITDELLLKGRDAEDSASARSAREDGNDKYNTFRQSGGWATVWINENFMRIDGVDYHFWSVGRHGPLSEVREVHEAYPALHGERPYVLGVSQIDSHQVFPMSPVESWQPLQQEINDVTNLRLDTLMRSISPLTIVKRGKNVDLTQLQRRGRPDAIVQVDSMDDVEVAKTPGPSGAAYTETSVANAGFDELSGSFSSSSVQQSRQLNETVGGMKLMSGSANAITEFDLRVWSETFVEPVFRQLVQLISFYESDEKMMAICGEKARTRAKYGYEPRIDDLLEAEVMVTVSAGVGALDPAQKMAKFRAGMEMIMPLYPMMQEKGVDINLEEIIAEVMGNVGHAEGKRFFTFDGQPKPNPEQEADKAEKQAEAMQFMKELQHKKDDLEFKKQKTAMDNQTKIQIANMDNQTDLEEKRMGVRADGQQVTANAQTDRRKRWEEYAMREEEGRKDRNHAKELVKMQPKPVASSGGGASANGGSPSPRPSSYNPPLEPSNNGSAAVMAGVNGQFQKLMAQNQAAIAQNNAMIAQALTTLAQAVDTLGKPKQVVRDASGKVTGVE